MLCLINRKDFSNLFIKFILLLLAKIEKFYENSKNICIFRRKVLSLRPKIGNYYI